jgi:hypothetical protein
VTADGERKVKVTAIAREETEEETRDATDDATAVNRERLQRKSGERSMDEVDDRWFQC